MKPATKQERQNKRLAQLLGIDPEEVQALRSKEDADDKIREAQAILLFVERPEAFISKKCDSCHGQFLTTYQFVSVCSTVCRIKSLAKVGIEWNPLHTPEERWKRSKIPTEYTIPPRALQVLLKLAQEQSDQQAAEENRIAAYQAAAYYQIPDSISVPPEAMPSILPSYNDVQEDPPATPPASKDAAFEALLLEYGLDPTQ